MVLVKERSCESLLDGYIDILFVMDHAAALYHTQKT